MHQIEMINLNDLVPKPSQLSSIFLSLELQHCQQAIKKNGKG